MLFLQWIRALFIALVVLSLWAFYMDHWRSFPDFFAGVYNPCFFLHMHRIFTISEGTLCLELLCFVGRCFVTISSMCWQTVDMVILKSSPILMAEKIVLELKGTFFYCFYSQCTLDHRLITRFGFLGCWVLMLESTGMPSTVILIFLSSWSRLSCNVQFVPVKYFAQNVNLHHRV